VGGQQNFGELTKEENTFVMRGQLTVKLSILSTPLCFNFET